MIFLRFLRILLKQEEMSRTFEHERSPVELPQGRSGVRTAYLSIWPTKQFPVRNHENGYNLLKRVATVFAVGR